MSNSPIRRSHLVGMSGVGSMIVSTDGTTLIAAGLDHWFERADSGRQPPDLNEFKVEEWRLQRELRVDHFRLPPDFRDSRGSEQVPNSYLTIPFLRFPRWHVCRFCKHLERSTSSQRGKLRCKPCTRPGRKYGPAMAQVPFIAMCDYGHVQDFPWREWVHRALNPDCRRQLKLQATGAASLGAIQVSCDCGVKRSLARISDAFEEGESSYLSRHLTDDDDDYLCPGHMPWHNNEGGSVCSRPLRGTLLSASNVYFGLTRSSIYLPRGSDSVPSDLVSLFEAPFFSQVINLSRSADQPLIPSFLRSMNFQSLQPYSDDQITQAVAIISTPGSQYVPERDEDVPGDVDETRFRREEFRVLRKPRRDQQLMVRQSPLTEYEPEIASYFSRIMLVDKLRETRVQYGFARVFPEGDYDLEDRKALLWRDPPESWNNWLPAYLVYGEGIFLELDERRIQAWEQRADVSARIQQLAKRYERLQQARRLLDREIGPRFVLLHTFAHLLINRLAFECGYSSASLKERLYISENPLAPMAGMLIYTAAGDAEGTLGGLVRMGKPKHLEPVIRRALEVAQWCSADPICVELGRSGGQGPDSCNLAACHSCAILPETACEEFNRFLDRALVVGDVRDPGLGFFRL